MDQEAEQTVMNTEIIGDFDSENETMGSECGERTNPAPASGRWESHARQRTGTSTPARPSRNPDGPEAAGGGRPALPDSPISIVDSPTNTDAHGDREQNNHSPRRDADLASTAADCTSGTPTERRPAGVYVGVAGASAGGLAGGRPTKRTPTENPGPR